MPSANPSDPHTFGKIWPNLVLVRDTGRPPEFRVQCEITLDENQARKVEALLYKDDATAADIKSARTLVEPYINASATEKFRKIIALGFEGQRVSST